MITEFQREYRWLSNFYPAVVLYKGVQYSSVEHAYMSAKSDSNFFAFASKKELNWKEFCQDSSNSPATIKRMSRKITLVDNWDDIKLQVMEECLRSKFSQDPFKIMLLETGDQHLQEGNWWSDVYWGVNLKTNKGENNLGKLIMKIRTDLKSKNHEKHESSTQVRHDS